MKLPTALLDALTLAALTVAAATAETAWADGDSPAAEAIDNIARDLSLPTPTIVEVSVATETPSVEVPTTATPSSEVVPETKPATIEWVDNEKIEDHRNDPNWCPPCGRG